MAADRKKISPWGQPGMGLDPRKEPMNISRLVLRARASLGALLYQAHIISRITCFRWEMDLVVGQWTWGDCWKSLFLYWRDRRV